MRMLVAWKLLLALTTIVAVWGTFWGNIGVIKAGPALSVSVRQGSVAGGVPASFFAWYHATYPRRSFLGGGLQGGK